MEGKRPSGPNTHGQPSQMPQSSSAESFRGFPSLDSALPLDADEPAPSPETARAAAQLISNSFVFFSGHEDQVRFRLEASKVVARSFLVRQRYLYWEKHKGAAHDLEMYVPASRKQLRRLCKYFEGEVALNAIPQRLQDYLALEYEQEVERRRRDDAKRNELREKVRGRDWLIHACRAAVANKLGTYDMWLLPGNYGCCTPSERALLGDAIRAEVEQQLRQAHDRQGECTLSESDQGSSVHMRVRLCIRVRPDAAK